MRTYILPFSSSSTETKKNHIAKIPTNFDPTLGNPSGNFFFNFKIEIIFFAVLAYKPRIENEAMGRMSGHTRAWLKLEAPCGSFLFALKYH